MFEPTLDFFQRALGSSFNGFRLEFIKAGVEPSRVDRVILESAAGQSHPDTVILKRIAPDWPHDPLAGDRERRFYTELLPRLDAPHPRLYHAVVDPDTGYRVLLMEDLAADYAFRDRTHIWTADEVRPMLRTYARLHAHGPAALPDDRSWLLPRHESTWRADEVRRMIHGLVGATAMSPLHVDRFDQLVDRVQAGMDRFACEPPTLLHNDVYPPNVALPHALEGGDAMLIDWAMAGWGLAEMDLTYLFMQPFRSACALDRLETLRYYWQQRELIEGRDYPLEERLAVQAHADALMAVWFVPVAHRVWTTHQASGQPLVPYWEAMFGVLKDRWIELCGGI